jgi:3-deoxy-7-phosphoheptulonate synthase
MILVLRRDITKNAIERACQTLREHGLNAQLAQTGQHTVVVVSDEVSDVPSHVFSTIEGVEKVVRIQPQCPVALNELSGGVQVGNVTIGGGMRPVVIGGPCSVESWDQITTLAARVKESGGQMLRGGAFKPRTSPYDFPGLGVDALEYLAAARESTGLPVVSEVMSVQHLEQAEPFIDMFQIGARNMYNYELLKAVGRLNKPVLLKRAMSATISEFLQAAEYILLQGNKDVVLCERGIRTFESHTRNTLDLNAVAALKGMTNLPVIVDPSHGTGRRELIRPMSRAAIACGADGLMIEVHDQPSKALSDGSQAITPQVLGDIVNDVEVIWQALNGAVESAPATRPSQQAATLLS